MRYVNRDVVSLNLLVGMLPAALIPFAASVLGQYQSEAVAAARLRSGSHSRISDALGALRISDAASGTPVVAWTGDAAALAGCCGAPIVIYLLAMALADAAPTASLVLYLAMPLLYFVLITVLRQHPATRDEAEDSG